MRPLTWILVLLFLCIAYNAFAQAKPKIGIDCGTLAGKGRVAVVIDDKAYLYEFECGKEA